jgi:acyl-CoA reductase-like NAD-dependent aldehyde dehydrogenase
MVDQERQDERADLVSRLFAQLTSRFEDAATIAAECQGAPPSDELSQGAERLREMGQDAATIAEVIVDLIALSRES